MYLSIYLSQFTYLMQFTENGDQAAEVQLDHIKQYLQYIALLESKINSVEEKITILTNLQKLQALENNDQENQSSE